MLSNVIITYTKMEVRCLCLEICVYGWSPLPKHIFIYFNIFLFYFIKKWLFLIALNCVLQFILMMLFLITGIFHCSPCVPYK